MKPNPLFLYFICLFLLIGATQNLMAGITVGEKEKLKLYSDVRFRMELDKDSQKSDGTERSDRDRLRFRLRFGFDYQYDDYFSFGGRLRSGSAEAAQSPHITLGNELGPKTILIDKAFIKGTWKSGYYWVGKNSFHFWKQNELFWDDDVLPEGIAISQSFKVGEQNNVTAKGGYFVLDNSASNGFSDQAKLIAGQLAFSTSAKAVTVQAAAGYFLFRENPDQEDSRLADLDYDIGVFGAKVTLKDLPQPVTVGLDFMKNIEDYPATLFNKDQQTGYVISIKVGALNDMGDWLIGYYYAHVEKYAVVARFAQDDWLRWGSATETRSSNYQGHEFRAAFAFGPRNNVVARLYLVEGIEPESADAATKEDGTRFRLDWNIGF